MAGALTLGASGEPSRQPGIVTSVIDGDSIVVRLGGTPTHVRLIGVDAPEIHRSDKLERQLRRGWDEDLIRRLGERAKAYVERTLVRRRVAVELDVQERDRYGRLLAYVWLEDGTLLNAELLRHGHATRLTIPPNLRYADRFRALEASARESERGLWEFWPPTVGPGGPEPSVRAEPRGQAP